MELAILHALEPVMLMICDMERDIVSILLFKCKNEAKVLKEVGSSFTTTLYILNVKNINNCGHLKAVTF